MLKQTHLSCFLPPRVLPGGQKARPQQLTLVDPSLPRLLPKRNKKNVWSFHPKRTALRSSPSSKEPTDLCQAPVHRGIVALAHRLWRDQGRRDAHSVGAGVALGVFT